MSASEHDSCLEPVCCHGPASIHLQRNRYFKGKFMTERDFAADTEYLLSRHRLANRIGLGWGIACGLDVHLDRGDHCHPAHVKVGNGVAIDCYGRELVRCHATCLTLDPDKKSKHGIFLIAIRYHEKEVEPVPAIFSNSENCGCGKENNRIHECPEIRQIPWEGEEDEHGRFIKLGMECWPICCEEESGEDPVEEPCEGKDDGTPCRASGDHDTDGKPLSGTDCEPEAAKPDSEACCEQRKKQPCQDLCSPDCLCGEWVPLALVWVDKRTCRWEINRVERRLLREDSRRPLTAVTAVHGWSHGGVIGARETKHGDELGVLRIRFNRPLKHIPREDRHRLGINRQTFRAFFVCHVASSPGQSTSRVVVEPDEEPKYDPRSRTAVFRMTKFLKDYSKLRGTVEILLDCDFILDCDGRAVDGNFVGACLPSGNGTEGGSFRSWAKLPDPTHC